MSRRLRSPFFRLLAGLLTIAVTTGLLFVLRSRLNTPTVALLYVLAVGATTAWFGLIPGLTAALAAFFLFNYFFIPPFYTLQILQPEAVIDLLVLLVVAVVISQLLGRAQSGLSRARAQEHETSRLYELSTELIGQVDFDGIARTLARCAAASFIASAVRVSLRDERRALLAEAREPEGPGEPAGPPRFVQEIRSGRGSSGEIVLWGPQGRLSANEERLLRAFGSEAALALERAQLAQSETRARVLEQSDAMKSALLSSVSHELRSPLATILASVTSLASPEIEWDPAARLELLATIEEEADALNFLVGNLLDMSRIESGSLAPQRRSNALGEIVAAALSRMKRSLSDHQVALGIPPDLPAADVDYFQIEQVFANLVSNSAKYSPPGTTIRISAGVEDQQWLRVQVENQGQPVVEDHLDRIFDKFHRIYPDERITGTGLGLSICKGIVEAHGGRIWASNLPGGVAFLFTLPRAASLPKEAGTL
jgi:two-component system sensor histidine kinase KdpD